MSAARLTETRAPSPRGARAAVEEVSCPSSTVDLSHDAGEADGVVARLDRVKAWVRDARAGDRMAYATRRVGALPVNSATAAWLRTMQEAGVINLAQVRVDHDTKTYLAERTRACLPDAPSSVPPELRGTPVRGKLLRLLDRRASLGRASPSDMDIASICGCSQSLVATVLQELEEDGEIVVEGKGVRRVITIVRTGEWTEAR